MVGVPEGRSLVGDEELLARRGLPDVETALGRLVPLGNDVLGRDRLARDSPVGARYGAQQLALAHVAHHDEGGVVRRVVRPVEGDAVLRGEALDVLHPADGRPVVRVALEGRLVEKLVGDALDVVVDPVAPLVGDDLLLARDLRLAQHEILHPLGLELERQLHAVGRQQLVVVGPVDPGRRVGLGPAFLELAVEHARPEVLGLPEHQVLEEVREPRLAGALVAGPDLVPGVQGRDRRARVDQHEHREPVAEAPAVNDLAAAEGMGSFVDDARAVPLDRGVDLLGPRPAERAGRFGVARGRHLSRP